MFYLLQTLQFIQLTIQSSKQVLLVSTLLITFTLNYN